MADQSDVEQALVDMIGAVLYPNGVSTQLPPAPSIVGAPARIFRGWPNGLQLDKDLAAGTLNVSVYTPNGFDRNTSRYPNDWQVSAPPAPTLTATVEGITVIVGGAVSPPQNIAVKIGRKAYPYAVQTGDTLASIASALAALIAVDWPGAAAIGPVITLVNPAGKVTAAVGGYATGWRELRRQQKRFQIVFWTPTPELRDQAVSLIDAYLAGVERFTLPDNSVARLIYAASTQNDAPEKERLFRRDLLCTIEYPTTQIAPFAQIVAFETTLTSSPPT